MPDFDIGVDYADVDADTDDAFKSSRFDILFIKLYSLLSLGKFLAAKSKTSTYLFFQIRWNTLHNTHRIVYFLYKQ